MARKQCVRCDKAQAVRPGGLCNRCFAAVARDGTGETMGRVETIPLDTIRVDGGTQARAGGVQEQTAQEYAEAIRDGAVLPPGVVFRDAEGVNWLAGGFHRRRACEIANLAEMACEVRDGGQRDALLYAIGDNAAHGLKRSAEDKRRAVMLLLEDQQWGRWGTPDIAKAARVSYDFAAKIRKQYDESRIRAGQEVPTTRTTSDGRQYPTHIKRRDEVDEDDGASPEMGDTPISQDPPRADDSPGYKVGLAQTPCWRCTCGRLVTMDRTECPDCGDDQPRHMPPAPTVEAEKPKSPAKPKPPELRDQLGNVIPVGMQDVFGDPFMADAVSRLLEIRRGLRSVARWAPYVRMAEAVDGVEKAMQAIEDGMPYCVHQRCRGRGCEQCRGCGYLARWRHEELQGQQGGAA